ncbi:MAG: hypothetical protein ACLPH3_24200 [Terracidiphilus sp.]
MSKMIAIKRVALNEGHLRPGRTRHSSNGKEFRPFTSLAICQSPGDAGYFLMHIGEKGQAADTWHENLEDAMHQAEWEFGVQAEEWTEANEPF